MIAASVWGNPAKGKLLSSLKATPVAAERLLDLFRNLPFIPDELQTIKEMFKDFSSMIYAFTQGKGKDRGTIDGGLAKPTEWDNITIMSGEEPITGDSDKEGTKNRVIEIEENKPLFEEKGENVVNFILKNYGFAGKEFIEIIQKMSEEELTNLKKSYTSQLREVIQYDKQINAMSVIMIADYIVSTHIFNEEPFTVEDVKDYFRTDTDEADRVIDIIIDYANANINNFCCYISGKDSYIPTGQIWGRIDLSHDGDGKIMSYSFIPGKLYEILEKCNIKWNGVKRKLADKGYIYRNEKTGKYGQNKRIGKGNQKVIEVKNIYF